MKKFLIIISLITIAIESAHAACSTGYSPVNLDPDIEPTNYTYDEENMTWDVTASYGDLSGIAVCNSTQGTWATASGTDFPTGTSDEHCWCKMLSPARSAWVYNGSFGSADGCATSCAHYCGRSIRVPYGGDFRSAMFGSACIPNTISINWKDATGSTASSTTCTYDDALVTPSAAPTKRGHVFTGWSYQ